MDLTIVQRLVCPMPHASTPLVVRADSTVHGRMDRGVLGCPTCNAEWQVVEGIAQFGPRADLHADVEPETTTLAALLGLSDPHLVVVDGSQGPTIDELVRAYNADVVALDAAATEAAITRIDGAAVVPLADGIARGVALMRSGRDARFLESAVRVLAPEGRLVGAATIAMPDGVRELARNEELWVAEREAPVVRVELRRR